MPWRPSSAINVFLADNNLIVREGGALIERNADLKVIGAGADYDGAVSGCAATEPQVLVTDVRLPPSYHREGLDVAKEVRKRQPGTGVVVLSQYDDPEVVVLSQYDDPEYAVSLRAEGSAGCGYLPEGPGRRGQPTGRAIREVATGGTALDPAIVDRRPGAVRPGIGLSAGAAPTALRGCEKRLEYTLVGDTVNRAQRLQQLAAARRDGTRRGHEKRPARGGPAQTCALPVRLVKGRCQLALAAQVATAKLASHTDCQPYAEVHSSSPWQPETAPRPATACPAAGPQT